MKRFSECPLANNGQYFRPCSIIVFDQSDNNKVLLCNTCGKSEHIDLEEIVKDSNGFGNLFSLLAIAIIVMLIANSGQPSQNPNQPQTLPSTQRSLPQ